MITGAHSIIYSKNPDADRDFFRDILKLTKVDVGQGWLIFGLPPAEILFLSDVVAELDAARAAGMQTGLVVRPGNAKAEQTATNPHPVIENFAQVELTSR